MTLKLLIVEDVRDVAEVVAFGARMTWPGCQVTIAETGTEALRCFAQEPVDLVVLDMSIPPPDGLEVCRRMRDSSQVPILMLTVRDSTLDKVRAFDLGVDDYLTKPFDHLELLARLRALLRRAHHSVNVRPLGLSSGELVLDTTTHMVWINGVAVHLTSTEYRLLEELMRHPGIVLSHHTLLDRVWGPEYAREAHYLKVFVRRLRQKLGDNADSPRYIQTEWGIGYRFSPLP